MHIQGKNHTRMKRVGAFILAIFYLSFTLGATLHQHYCMGELVGTSLFHPGDNECGKCGMKKHAEASKDCCKDVSIVVKAGGAHTFSQPDYNVLSFVFTLPPADVICTSLNIPQGNFKNLYRAHSPPLLKQPLFILFNNFRI